MRLRLACGVDAPHEQVDEVWVEADLQADHPEAGVVLEDRMRAALHGVLGGDQDHVGRVPAEGVRVEVEVVAERLGAAVDVVGLDHGEEASGARDARGGERLEVPFGDLFGKFVDRRGAAGGELGAGAEAGARDVAGRPRAHDRLLGRVEDDRVHLVQT